MPAPSALPQSAQHGAAKRPARCSEAGILRSASAYLAVTVTGFDAPTFPF